MLSIIIVSWNTAELLENCIASILANPSTSPFEIWVVDNASTDNSPGMVRERFPQVHLIENRTNVGFARANNQALQRCGGDYILLLNPDTLVSPGALQALVDFMNEHPEAGAAGARLLNPDSSLQISSHPHPTLSRELWRLLHFDTLLPYAVYPTTKWDTSQPQEVDLLMGACLLVRKDALDQVGFLDEDYFIYSEEIDLCYRIQRAGWRIFWVPQAEVVHFGGQSTQQVPTEMFLNLYQSKIKYFRKHHGWPGAQIYKSILRVAALSRILLTPFVIFEHSSRRQKHLTLVDRYWRLVRALPRM
ncbi:MAG TPA: glycosyltransferase family 2 protein [Anaerolineales bacterium]|nr:glycosyltransferase family 2 protein [Anaerolineales bacterium]